MRPLFVGALAYTVAMRLFELGRSRRNLERTLAQRGRLVENDGFRLLAAVHAAWLVGMVVEELVVGPTIESVLLRNFAFLLFFASELMRLWCILTLGERWNVRVVVTRLPPVRRGPYAFLHHPNYLAALVGIVALPLALGLVWTPLLALPAKLWALWKRILVEDDALGQ